MEQKLKKKRTLLPVDSDDIYSLEKYFEMMSLKGYHFESFCGYCVFTVGDSKEYRYRAEPYNNKTAWPDHEKLNYYEECGWEFVNKFGNMYEIFRTEDISSPELHSDSVVESLAYENLVKRMRSDMIGHTLYDLFLSCMIIRLWIFCPEPVKLFVETANFILPVALISLLFSARTAFMKYSKIKKIKNDLASGISPRENATAVFMSKTKTATIFWGNVLLCVFLIVMLIGQYTGDGQRSINEYDVNLVRIEDLVDDENFYVPQTSQIRDIDLYSQAHYDTSAVTDIMFNYYQGGFIKDPGFYEGMNGAEEYGTEFFVTVYTDFYALKAELLAYPLVKDLMHEEDAFKFTEIADERFDHLYAGYYGENQMIVAAKDKNVISVKFRIDMPGGTKKYPVTGHLDEILSALTAGIPKK